MLEKTITSLLEDRFSLEEFEHLFLVDLDVSSNGFRIKVFIDGDEGVHFRECVRTSRYLEENLEEQNLVPEKYMIEVSSPGVSRPLQLRRQYPKHIGRELEIKFNTEAKKISGELKDVGEDFIILEIDPTPVKGVSIKDLEREQIKIMLSEIDRAIVQISFK